MKALIRHLREHMDLNGCYWEVAALPWDRAYGVSNDVLLEMVRRWHELFFEAIDDYLEERGGSDLGKKRVLCGFNVVNDEVYYLASEDDLQKLVDAWGISQPSPTVPASPTSLEEVLSCIAQMAADPNKEGKWPVGDDARPAGCELLGEIRKGSWVAGLHGMRLLGGAAGNMAYILGHLGVRTLLHCPYHAGDINWSELDDSVEYLAVSPSQDTPRKAREPAADLPYKTTAGFQLCPSWQHSGLGITVSDSARALFMGREVRRASGDRSWARVLIETQGHRVEWDWTGAGANAWPHPQILCGIGSIHGDLTIYAPEFGEIIRREAGHPIRVAILGGLGIPQTPAVLDDIRRDQLSGLRKVEVAIHTELSDRVDIPYLVNVVENTQTAKTDPSPSSGWSVGLNDDDALKLSEKARWEGDYIAALPDGKYVQRFERGVCLLKELGVDWVYIHGTDIDMAIWRSGLANGLGQQLRDAMLFAKAAVIGGMIRRTVPPHLWPMMRHHLENSSLASGGFHALSEFAANLDAALSRRAWKGAPAGVRSRLLGDGYTDCGRPKDRGWDFDVGVSVAPVYWPPDASFLSATGAGDFTSAVVAAYVW